MEHIVLSKHPLYRVWGKMKERCYNKNSKAYKNYGVLGITICDKWLNSAKDFVEWGITNGWEKGLQIDKDIICKQKGICPQVYSPETCCFVTRAVNNLHKRNNRIVEYRGKSQTLREWSN